MARPTKRSVWRVVTVVLTVLAFAAILLLQVQSNDSAKNAQSQANGLADQVATACKRGDDIAKQLAAQGLCQKATEVKQTPATEAPATTPATGTIPRSQVQSAVATFCAANNDCRGAKGANGQPGAPADQTAIVNAILARVPTPSNGSNGTNGANGKNATDDQVAAAVASYCASGACQGTAGADGKDGADGTNGINGTNGTDGKDAPTITSTDVDCNTGVVTTHLSDGTSVSGTATCPAVTTPTTESNFR